MTAATDSSQENARHDWVKKKWWTGMYCKLCNQSFSKETENSGCVNNYQPQSLLEELKHYKHRCEEKKLGERVTAIMGFLEQYKLLVESNDLDSETRNKIASILTQERTNIKHIVLDQMRSSEKKSGQTEVLLASIFGAGFGLDQLIESFSKMESLSEATRKNLLASEPTISLILAVIGVAVPGMIKVYKDHSESEIKLLKDHITELMNYDFSKTSKCKSDANSSQKVPVESKTRSQPVPSHDSRKIAQKELQETTLEKRNQCHIALKDLILLDSICASKDYRALNDNIPKAGTARKTYLNNIPNKDLQTAFSAKKQIWDAIQGKTCYQEIIGAIKEYTKKTFETDNPEKLASGQLLDSVASKEKVCLESLKKSIESLIKMLIEHNSKFYYNEEIFKRDFLDVLEYWGLARWLDLSESQFQIAIENNHLVSLEAMIKCFGNQLDPKTEELIKWLKDNRKFIDTSISLYSLGSLLDWRPISD
jgi:hypothetical protein